MSSKRRAPGAGGMGTPPGAGGSSVRNLAPHRARATLAQRLFGPGTILAGVGLVLGLVLAAIPAPDRPEATPESRAKDRRIHRVQEGDNLRDLAREYYDDPSQWRQIFLANREKLVRDGRLVPGDEIVIPIFEAKDPIGEDRAH